MASNTYSQGAQVEHQKFGLGTVMSSSEERIVIKFDDHGEKKFVTNLVMGNLKKSDRQPPVEKRASRARRPKAVATPVAAARTGLDRGPCEPSAELSDATEYQ